MPKLLLRVGDVFALNRPGLVLEPPLPFEAVRRDPFAVRLRRPDGSERPARAVVDVAHTRNQVSWGAIRLLDVEEADVPMGTEIWMEAAVESPSGSSSRHRTMRFLLGLAPVLLLGACERPAPPPAPTASVASAAPKPSTVSSAPISAPSSPPPKPSASAAALTDAGATVACTFELPAHADSIAKIPGPVMAHAIIPSLDVAHMMAKLTHENTVDWITSCNGQRSQATWEQADTSKKTFKPGSVRFLGTKPLPDAREAVWLATGREEGNCEPEDGFGYFAIVALSEDGAHVNVLGVSAWRPECGPKRALRAEKLGAETVYVETDREASHSGSNGFENVWTLRNTKLNLAGHYDVSLTGAAESGAEVDDAGLYPPSFLATPRFIGGEIIVKGENTWQKPGDGGGGNPWVFAKKGPYLRTYEIFDGKLVEKKPSAKRK